MKIKIRTIFLSFFLSSYFGTSQAQPTVQQLDSLVHSLNANYQLAGNILIAAKGAVIYQKSLGYADVPQHVPLQENSAFQLASVSKVFTSLAILQLKEKAKLKLDDPLKAYFPDFKYGAITIRHLLSHTSGLVDYQIFEKPHFADTAKVFSNQDLIAAINNDEHAILAKPGERWSYSNSGYGLLALLVEKLSGMSFPAYLTKYIFKPAGMKHTYVYTPEKHKLNSHQVIGYDYLNYAPWILQRADSLKHNRIEFHNLGALNGPGNIISTTGDLLLFGRALYGAKLLKPASLQQAFIPTRLNNKQLAVTGWKSTLAYYGLGWMILKDSAYGQVVFHSGGMPGAVTLFLRNTTKDQTVILLNNVTHRETHAAGINLFRLLNGGPLLREKESLANLYARTLFRKGADAALVKLNEFKTDTTQYYLSERELNLLGLHMFYAGHQANGLEALRLNTILYPASANVYDSYAAALQGMGRKQEAILMYKKSLQLNPNNKGGQKALEALYQSEK